MPFTVLTSKCSNHINDQYEYKRFIPLRDIPNSKPNGFIARIVVYVQGERDAYILLSEKENPATNDDVYEFCKWQNDVYDLLLI